MTKTYWIIKDIDDEEVPWWDGDDWTDYKGERKKYTTYNAAVRDLPRALDMYGIKPVVRKLVAKGSSSHNLEKLIGTLISSIEALKKSLDSHATAKPGRT
jgi:hypothetical protein